jgi:hypothetical protein
VTAGTAVLILLILFWFMKQHPHLLIISVRGSLRMADAYVNGAVERQAAPTSSQELF